MKNQISVITLLFVQFFALHLFGQDPTFTTIGSEVTSLDECDTNGFRLIEESNISSSASAVWCDNIQLDLSASFQLQFEMRFSDDDTGADGLTFTMHRDPNGLSAIGGIGGDLGISAPNIMPSVSIEFDVFDNLPDFGDIATDHIAFVHNGNLSSPVVAAENLGNIEDGFWRTVDIRWDALSTTLCVAIDGMNIACDNQDLITTIFGGVTDEIYWGFTAGNGSFSSNHDICVNYFDIDYHLVSLDFDGVNDRVYAEDNPVVGDVDFTIEAWFLSEDADGASTCSGNFERLIGFGGTRFELGECGGEFTFFSELSGLLPSSVNTLDGMWHHVAATKNGANLIVYLDGVSVITHTFTGTFDLNNNFRVGHWSAANLDETWDGKIDEVRLWDFARTEADILATMNTCLIGNETGLVTYYNFNQGIPEGDNTGTTIIPDLSPTGNDGTLLDFGLMGANSNFVGLAPFEMDCDMTCYGKAEFITTQQCLLTRFCLLQPLNEGATILWNFGDGVSSTLPKPVHFYDCSGTYEVCVIINDGDCIDEYCTEITVANGYRIGENTTNVYIESITIDGTTINNRDNSFTVNIDTSLIFPLGVIPFTGTTTIDATSNIDSVYWRVSFDLNNNRISDNNEVVFQSGKVSVGRVIGNLDFVSLQLPPNTQGNLIIEMASREDLLDVCYGPLIPEDEASSTLILFRVTGGAGMLSVTNTNSNNNGLCLYNCLPLNNTILFYLENVSEVFFPEDVDWESNPEWESESVCDISIDDVMVLNSLGVDLLEELEPVDFFEINIENTPEPLGDISLPIRLTPQARAQFRGIYTGTIEAETQDGTVIVTYTTRSCIDESVSETFSGYFSIIIGCPDSEINVPCPDTCSYYNYNLGVSVESQKYVDEINKFVTYPNPFTDEFIMEFELKKRTNSSIKLFNILGEEIKQIINNQSFPAGKHQISVSGENLSSGYYFLGISFDDFQFGKPIIHTNN